MSIQSRVIELTDPNGGFVLFNYHWNDFADATTGDRGLVGNAKLTKTTTGINTLSCDVYPQMLIPGGRTAGEALANYTPYHAWLYAYITDDSVSHDPYTFDDMNDVCFTGRIVEISKQMDADGVYYYHIVAEGLEAQLLDIPFDNSAWLDPTQGNVDEYGYVDSAAYMQFLIDEYNAHYLDGDLADGSGEIPFPFRCPLATREAYPGSGALTISKPYKPSVTSSGVILDEMRNIVEKCGGGLLFSYLDDNGALTSWRNLAVTWAEIDQLSPSQQTIEATLGESLESCEVRRDYANIVNRVRVVGSTYTTTTPIESESEEQEYLSTVNYVSGAYYLEALQPEQITQLFDGTDIDYEVTDDHQLYVFNPESVDAYVTITRGLQITGYDDGAELEEDEETGAKSFDHIDIDPDRAALFMAEAIDYIRENSEPQVTINADIVNPSIIYDSGAYTPKIYNDVHIENELIDIDETHTILNVTYDMCNPIRDSIGIGTKPKDSSASLLARALNAIDDMEERKLERPATTGRLGGVKLPRDGSIWGDKDGTIHARGAKTDFTQYMQRDVDWNENPKPRYKYHTGEVVSAFDISDGDVLDLAVPGRTMCDITFTAYYAGVVFWQSYCDAYGRPMNGLLTTPSLFRSQIYNHIMSMMTAKTLTWSVVEPLVKMGIIAYQPGRHNAYGTSGPLSGPLIWTPPYVVTGAQVDTIDASFSPHNAYPFAIGGVTYHNAWEKIGRISDHPKYGVIELYWALVSASVQVSNYSADGHQFDEGGFEGVYTKIAFPGIDVDFGPPSYAVIDGSNNAGRPTNQLSFNTDHSPSSMYYWGHSVCVGTLRGTLSSSIYGMNIDTGERVLIARQFNDLRNPTS